MRARECTERRHHRLGVAPQRTDLGESAANWSGSDWTKIVRNTAVTMSDCDVVDGTCASAITHDMHLAPVTPRPCGQTIDETHPWEAAPQCGGHVGMLVADHQSGTDRLRLFSEARKLRRNTSSPGSPTPGPELPPACGDSYLTCALGGDPRSDQDTTSRSPERRRLRTPRHGTLTDWRIVEDGRRGAASPLSLPRPPMHSK